MTTPPEQDEITAPPEQEQVPTPQEIIGGLELELNAAGNRALQQSIVITRLVTQLKATQTD
tara:strand:+ start:706 stop:888 length:183 start_codon:yes stop_codon:yes gene_type:complete